MRPNLRPSTPRPPPSASPAIPTLGHDPPGTATPWGPGLRTGRSGVCRNRRSRARSPGQCDLVHRRHVDDKPGTGRPAAVTVAARAHRKLHAVPFGELDRRATSAPRRSRRCPCGCAFVEDRVVRLGVDCVTRAGGPHESALQRGAEGPPVVSCGRHGQGRRRRARYGRGGRRSRGGGGRRCTRGGAVLVAACLCRAGCADGHAHRGAARQLQEVAASHCGPMLGASRCETRARRRNSGRLEGRYRAGWWTAALRPKAWGGRGVSRCFAGPPRWR